ncbi:unnamed protein product [Effrenium voratum]|uniref:Uncharacterized protein n=1 Tax=Effrenium voratum TaxID=2562239 RepID=A0AA36J064_9DINO|nr:unnamed protein product [Effrenium voratum]
MCLRLPERAACHDELHGDGFINQTALVGDVAYEKNQTAPVWLFCYVLLVGFGVKAVMLCPGVFSPYPHFRRYDPELTANLRYIIVTVPSAGENKCTVLRNIVGAVGCMPKDCRCRYHVAFVDEGHRAEQKVMFMKLAAVIERIPNFGGISYEENVSRFFQIWVEDTKKMDLQKVKDGYSGEVDAEIMARMSGKNTLRKLRKEGGWGSMAVAFEPLEQALQVLEEDLKSTKKEKKETCTATTSRTGSPWTATAWRCGCTTWRAPSPWRTSAPSRPSTWHLALGTTRSRRTRRTKTGSSCGRTRGRWSTAWRTMTPS